MSKYLQRGAYHFELFQKLGDPYRNHVLNLVGNVIKHTKYGASILDVGCGEGLVLHVLQESGFGFKLLGFDADPEAVRLARLRKLPVNQGVLEDVCDHHSFDAIMMLDVLEHVPQWRSYVAKAQKMADTIFIAIPDRNDPHACNKELSQADIIDSFSSDWHVVHQETRHARHFMVFQRFHANNRDGNLRAAEDAPETTGCDRGIPASCP